MRDQKDARGDKLVYSTEKGKVPDAQRSQSIKEAEKDLEKIRRKIGEAQREQNAEAFADILVELGEVRGSKSFKRRLTAFRRACNLTD